MILILTNDADPPSHNTLRWLNYYNANFFAVVGVLHQPL